MFSGNVSVRLKHFCVTVELAFLRNLLYVYLAQMLYYSVFSSYLTILILGRYHSCKCI